MHKTISCNKSTLFTKIRVVYLSAFFLIVFSSYFLIQILPVSPVYFTYLISIFLFFVTFSYKNIPSKQNSIYLIVFLSALSFIIIPIWTLPATPSPISSVKYAFITFFFFLYYIFVDALLYQLTKKEIMKILNAYFICNILLFVADLYTRIMFVRSGNISQWVLNTSEFNPILAWTYAFKFGGLIGVDSNVTGLFILPPLCLATFLIIEKKSSAKIKIYCLLFFILLVSTGSRAAIISFLLLFCFLFLQKTKSLILKFSFVFIFIILSLLLYNFTKEDGSGSTKIYLYETLFNYIKNISYSHFFFGMGYGTTPEVFGFFAHNIIALIIVEYGFIVLFLYFVSFFVIFNDVGKNYIYMLPFFIASIISLGAILTPFIFVAFALIKHINRKNMFLLKKEYY